MISSRFEEGPLGKIPEKARWCCLVLLVSFVLLIARLWYLTTVDHEKRHEEAFFSRKRTLVERPNRGTIRDRNNVLLAGNMLQYRLSIVYSDIRQIPAFCVDKATGKRTPLRKLYISRFASMLARHVALPQDRIEDLIHSYAALYDTIPFVIERELSEAQYYRLRAQMKNYPGLLVEAVPKRYYPLHSVGSHVVGYTAPIPKATFDTTTQEIRTLAEYVRAVEDGIDVPPPEDLGITSYIQAKQHLFQLREKAYAMNDSVGVCGIEESCENDLRGYCGKQVFFSDAKGSLLRKLPGSRDPVPGKRIYLSISAELQAFCERLLIQAEKERGTSKTTHGKEPRIKGGAIVAIDPRNGEVLALASTPRFDPNEFVQSHSDRRLSYLCNDEYCGALWDGKMALFCEEVVDDAIVEATVPLSWNTFIELLLPTQTPILQQLHPQVTCNTIVAAQKAFANLLSQCPNLTPAEVMDLIMQGQLTTENPALRRMQTAFTSPQEALLFLDIGRLVFSGEQCSQKLLQAKGELTIGQLRTLSCEYAQARELIKKTLREQYHETEFAAWKKTNAQESLSSLRAIEKAKKQKSKPYLEYLDAIEKRQFTRFWNDNKELLLYSILLGNFQTGLTRQLQQHFPHLHTELQSLSSDLAIEFLKALPTFSDLGFPLYGRYRNVNGTAGKHLLHACLSSWSSSALRSYAFRQQTVQGSIFKLVTAYAGLKQAYHNKKDLRLFEITDQTFSHQGKRYVGYFGSGEKIPQIYKEGRIPKSIRSNLGAMELTRAIATSSNVYFALLAGDYLQSPTALIDAAHDFGYGEKTQILLPGELPGSIPQDLEENKTGVYATAIGQHTLITTPLQTAMMLSAIANGGTLFTPKIMRFLVGKELPYEPSVNAPFLFKEMLSSIGIDFPLFLKPGTHTEKELIEVMPHVRRKLFMPKEIQETLFTGMRGSIMHAFSSTKHKELLDAFIGKTSTAEVIEHIGIDKPTLHNHTWFGGITPDLVIVVYLRFGSYGKNAAPIALAVASKWHQICRTPKESV